MPFDLSTIIIATGYLGVTSTIFLESGTILGLFLPGDSLLFTIGFLSSQHIFDIRVLLLLLIPAAIIGDIVGYATGKMLGPKLFINQKSKLFKPKYLLQAELFFNQHGPRAILFARFVPVVRCLVPIVAGVGRMNYRNFLIYNIIGAFAWAGGLTILGYFLGRSIPNAEQYLLPIVLLIILVSLIPTVIHFWKARASINSSKDSDQLSS